jgi:hypothetical protein
MALVGETGLGRHDRRRLAIEKEPTGTIQLPHDAELRGAGTECSPELTRHLPPRQPTGLLEFGDRMYDGGIVEDEFADDRDGFAGRRPCTTNAQRGLLVKRVGEGCDQLYTRDLAQGLVQVSKTRKEFRAYLVSAHDRVGDERQAPGVEGTLDECRIDVENPVSEAVRRPGHTVMHFVGMQDVALAG